MQKITPFLWFDSEAEDAMKFYTSVFKNSKIGDVRRYSENGAVMTATFELNGLEFMALNAGPHFKFNEAVSFFIKCDTQEEIDYYWNNLSAGGLEQPCGWLKDKFGLSWQVVPPILGKLLGDKDPVKSKRVMDAMMKMKKIDIKKLEEAYKGK